MPSSVAESRSAGEASTSEQVRLFKSSLLGRRFPGMRELPDEQIAAILKHDTKASKRALEVKTHPKSDFAPATLPPAEPARIFYPVNPTQARDTAKRQDSEVSVRQPAMQKTPWELVVFCSRSSLEGQKGLGLACRARLSLLQGCMQPRGMGKLPMCCCQLSPARAVPKCTCPCCTVLRQHRHAVQRRPYGLCARQDIRRGEARAWRLCTHIL